MWRKNFSYVLHGASQGSLDSVRKEFIALRKENWLSFLNPVRQSQRLRL